MSNTRKRSHKHKRKLTVNRKNRKTRRVKRNPSRKHRSRRKFFGGVLTPEQKKWSRLIDPNDTFASRASKARKKTSKRVNAAENTVRNDITKLDNLSPDELYTALKSKRKYMIQYILNENEPNYQKFYNHAHDKILLSSDKSKHFEKNMVYEINTAKKEIEKNDLEKQKDISQISDEDEDEKNLMYVFYEGNKKKLNEYINGIENYIEILNKSTKQSSIDSIKTIQNDNENINEKNIFQLISNQKSRFLEL